MHFDLFAIIMPFLHIIYFHAIAIISIKGEGAYQLAFTINQYCQLVQSCQFQ